LEREQKARAEAEAANRARDEFIGVISHELRSPLQTILGWVDLLCRGKLDSETESRAIETIQRNAALQNRLINDLLDITRIQAGTLLPNIAPVDLKNVVEAVVDNVRPMVDEKGIHLQTSIAPDLKPISGDAERLQQVITNLVNNAIKFTPQGGQVEVRVNQLHNEASRAAASIQVIDSGIGIRPDFLPHIFDAYTQAGTNFHSEKGGLGLGLSIVQELVRLHGGKVEVESAGVGKGATFTVHLPLQETKLNRNFFIRWQFLVLRTRCINKVVRRLTYVAPTLWFLSHLYAKRGSICSKLCYDGSGLMSLRSTAAMKEYLCEDEIPSPVDEFLRTERELSLLCREAESFEAMRWLVTLEQELQSLCIT
jgi:two-component sensor histidine kinase